MLCRLVRLRAVSCELCVVCVCNIDGLLDNTLMDYKIIARNKAPPPQPSEIGKNHFYQLNPNIQSQLIFRIFIMALFSKRVPSTFSSGTLEQVIASDMKVPV